MDFNLYLITDRKLLATPNSELQTPNLLAAVEDALKAGVKAVQLREKDLAIRELLYMAYKMRELTRKYNARLFINDRVDVALSVEADGVHLGQQSMPPYAVRKIAQSRLMIGVSTHSPEEAKRAEDEGADFITLGPIYETPSKLRYGKPIGIETIKRVKSQVSIPVFAIGGIKEDKVKDVMGAGADGIALISGIFGAENIGEETRKLLKLL